MHIYSVELSISLKSKEMLSCCSVSDYGSAAVCGLQVSPATQRRIRASLSDLDNEEAIENLSVRQLKEILARNFVNYSGCCEKWELLERVHRLYRENEQNRKSSEHFEFSLFLTNFTIFIFFLMNTFFSPCALVENVNITAGNLHLIMSIHL